MNKLLVMLSLGLVAILVSATIVLASPATGLARLHQVDQSGIEARINFVDTGSALQVSGTATGLDPSKAYISLLYDVGSEPGGPLACEPSANDNLTFAQMLVGSWQPIGSSTRTLTAVKAGDSYAALGTFDTVSVREQPTAALRACGQVAAQP